jgi:hypothetical protein
VNDDVWFRVEGREYRLAQRKAEVLPEGLRAFDPNLKYGGSVRRSLSEAIERCLVDPTEWPCLAGQRRTLGSRAPARLHGFRR